MQVNLTVLKPASVGYVSHIGGNHTIKKHMQTAGFYEGAKVVVLHISPYTGSYLLDVGGFVKTFKKMAVSLVEVNI